MNVQFFSDISIFSGNTAPTRLCYLAVCGPTLYLYDRSNTIVLLVQFRSVTVLSSVSFLKNEHNSNKAYIGEGVHEQEQLLILHVYTVRERSNTIVLLLTIWYQGTWNSFFALELFPGYNNSLWAL
jgi:hypothetical protein